MSNSVRSFFGTFLFLSISLSAQNWKRLPASSEQPEWEQVLWAQPWTVNDSKQVVRVYDAYEAYRRKNPDAPTRYADRYVRAWLRHNYVWNFNESAPSQAAPEGLGTWTPVGPTYVNDGVNQPTGEQANVYTIAMAGGTTLYAGTEPGQVYRSTNQGLSWQLTALNVPFTSGIQALAGNPLNGQCVYAATYNAIYRSVDSGLSWILVRQGTNLHPNELLVAAYDTNVVYAATNEGLLRSSNRGATWTTLIAQPTYDVQFLPGGVAGRTVYALTGSGQERALFYRSHDFGATFVNVGTGWYQSTHPNRVDLGGRIAVTPADTNRVYAYLIGDAKPGDNGFIGLFSSSDRGASWTLPRGHVGAPFTQHKPNTAIGAPGWTYHQGFYNCALAVNPNNADEVLIGGLSLWKSMDGGATALAMAGYASDSVRMHVDMQDFRLLPTPSGGSTLWVSTDGGIYRSSDFVQTQPDIRMNGVQATEFWSLGQAWNEDVLVAGAYHNGVLARRENYASGLFVQLGGGEPPSGYADPMVDGRVYSSEVGGVQLPVQPAPSTPPQYFSFTAFPNESYWPTEASTMVFDPRYPSEVLIGVDHRLMKSLDGGMSYHLIHAFGTDPAQKLGMVVQGYRQPEVLYVVQRESWSPVKLFRSLDSGATWNQVVLPSGVGSRMALAVAPDNAQHLLVVFPEAPDGIKVWRSLNGGQQWVNWSTASINGEELRSVVRAHGTSPSWIAAGNREVYVRYDTSSVWRVWGQGLPHPVQTRDLAVHYGLGKVRIATYGRGMWECDLPSTITQPLAQPMVANRQILRKGCGTDSVRFASRSIVSRSGTTWHWRFPGGSPTSSTDAAPTVYYATPGTFQAWLRVNHLGAIDSAQVSFEIASPTGTLALADFEGPVFPDPNIWTQSMPGGTDWQRAEWTAGNHAARADNYYHDAQGATSDLVFKVSRADAPVLLTYEYAYAPYGFPYVDSLLVLVSPNCDLTAPIWIDTLASARLQTAPGLTSAMFVPTSTEWKSDSVDFTSGTLSASISGLSEWYVGFRNIGRYGQAVYLDQIALTSNLSLKENVPQSAVVLAPSPALSGSMVQSWPSLPSGVWMEWFSTSGKRISASQVRYDGSVVLPTNAEGLLIWRVLTDDRAWVGRIMVL